jgi:hypothetical protein
MLTTEVIGKAEGTPIAPTWIKTFLNNENHNQSRLS